jgi:ABC-type transport system substrate-binding protein
VLGLRTDFHVTPFQEVIKELEGGKFQSFSGGYGGVPFGYAQMFQLDSRQPVTVNSVRFKLAEYDRTVDRFLASSNEEGRVAAARQASAIAAAYVPILPTIFRLENDFVQPWVQGYSPPVWTSYWKYLDIDPARRRAMAR